MILWYIEVALGFIGVNVIGFVGCVSKRKILRIGPKCPKGSNAMGIRTILRSRRSPMTVSPVVVMGFVFASDLLFFFFSVDVSRHWPSILL